MNILSHIKTPREMVLLLLIVWVLALLLLSSAIGKTNRWRLEQNQLAAQRQAHQATLAMRGEVDAELDRILETFNPDETPTVEEFVGGVDALLRQLNLRPDLTSPITRESEFFRFHTLRVVFRRAELANLVRFTQRLSSDQPLIGIESLAISAGISNPRELDATFSLRAIELRPERLGNRQNIP